MLWTSLRLGWGNTGPVILLGLLPLMTAVPAAIGQAPARPGATVGRHAPDAGTTVAPSWGATTIAIGANALKTAAA